MMLSADRPDITALEHVCMTAVPAQRVSFDGRFIVCAFLGGTGRANTASSVNPKADAELPARIVPIGGRYEALKLPV